jgi:hypothetical protein
MEKQAHQRGYQMRWQNTAWALLQHIEFVREDKGIITGRGITFKREKPSIFQKKDSSLPEEDKKDHEDVSIDDYRAI